MVIQNLTERELTQVEKGTIERLCRYTDDTFNFALIGSSVAVIISNAVDESRKNAIATVEQIAEDVLSRHPDFNIFRMDDGYAMTMMASGRLVILSEQELTQENLTEDGKVNFDFGLLLRQLGLACCDQLEIIALVFRGDGSGEQQ